MITRQPILPYQDHRFVMLWLGGELRTAVGRMLGLKTTRSASSPSSGTGEANDRPNEILLNQIALFRSSLQQGCLMVMVAAQKRLKTIIVVAC